VVHVDVKAGFLAREEKEPESVLAKDCRAQGLLFPATNACVQRRAACGTSAATDC
jgi:hypothetical protein